MKRRSWSSVLQWLPLLIPMFLGGILVSELAEVWAARLNHPFDLEWMEGGMLAHAWRVMQGQPMYVEPSAEFIPYVYPPGYAWCLAALGGWTDLGHPLGRAVSLLGTLSAAAAVLVFAVKHDENWVGSWISGAFGAVIFLACYRSSGAFYDLVRPDGLAIGLLAWALVFGLAEKRKWLAVGGILLFLAFLVKQHSAAWGIPVFLALWARDGIGRSVWWALWAAIPAGLWLGWTQLQEGQYPLTYLLSVPASHGLLGHRVFPGVSWEMGNALPLICGAGILGYAFWLCRKWKYGGGMVFVGVVAAVLLCAWLGRQVPGPGDGFFGGLAQIKRQPIGNLWSSMAGMGASAGIVLIVGLWAWRWLKGDRDWRWLFGISTVVITVLLATLMRGHVGGYINVYIPLHWCAALAFAMGTSKLLRWIREGQGQRFWLVFAIAAVVSLSFWRSHTTLRKDALVPTALDYSEGMRVVEALRGVQGPVLSPYAPWLPVQAGHDPSFHMIALWDTDTARHPTGPFTETRARVIQGMKDGVWGAVVDSSTSMTYEAALHYSEVQNLKVKRRALRGKTGWRQRPDVIRTRAPVRKAQEMQLPRLTGSGVVPLQGKMHRIEVHAESVKLNGEEIEMPALADTLRAHGSALARLAIHREVSSDRLAAVLIQVGRSGYEGVWLELENEKGLWLPAIPGPVSPPATRLVFEDGKMLLTGIGTSDRYQITVEAMDAAELAWQIPIVAIARVSGPKTVQQALLAWRELGGFGYSGAALGVRWPEHPDDVLSTPEQVEAVRSLISPQAQ